MPTIKKISFIGGGNMAEAIIKGLIGQNSGVQMMVAEITTERRVYLNDRYPAVKVVDNAAEAAQFGEIVILAIKPQQATSVLTALEKSLHPDQLVVSIMAGVRTHTIEEALEPGTRVVRVMPNTPALVGEGATAVCGGRKANVSDLERVSNIFAQIGQVVQVEEKLMDAVTGLSGSGPAFVCMFIEGLTDAGVKNGIPRTIAEKLAVQTVLGTAKLVHESGDHPALLRDKVTSPGGTTIAGMHALEVGAFKGTVMNAVDVATARSKELAGK